MKLARLGGGIHATSDGDVMSFRVDSNREKANRATALRGRGDADVLALPYLANAGGGGPIVARPQTNRAVHVLSSSVAEKRHSSYPAAGWDGGAAFLNACTTFVT